MERKRWFLGAAVACAMPFLFQPAQAGAPGRESMQGEPQAEFVSLSSVLKQSRLGMNEKIKWTPLVQGERSTALLIQARGKIKGHLHREHDEFLYVISGRGEMKVGDVVRKVRPKDLIYIPAGTAHEGFFEESTSVLSIYSPQFDQEHPDRVWVEGHP